MPQITENTGVDIYEENRHIYPFYCWQLCCAELCFPPDRIGDNPVKTVSKVLSGILCYGFSKYAYRRRNRELIQQITGNGRNDTYSIVIFIGW